MPSSKLTLAQITALQDECMAEDVAIEYEIMAYWSEAAVQRYFESGGEERPPVLAAPKKPEPPKPAPQVIEPDNSGILAWLRGGDEEVDGDFDFESPWPTGNLADTRKPRRVAYSIFAVGGAKGLGCQGGR